MLEVVPASTLLVRAYVSKVLRDNRVSDTSAAAMALIRMAHIRAFARKILMAAVARRLHAAAMVFGNLRVKVAYARAMKDFKALVVKKMCVVGKVTEPTMGSACVTSCLTALFVNVQHAALMAMWTNMVTLAFATATGQARIVPFGMAQLPLDCSYTMGMVIRISRCPDILRAAFLWETGCSPKASCFVLFPQTSRLRARVTLSCSLKLPIKLLK